MDEFKKSVSKRFRRIAIFELVMFLISCGGFYITYRYNGKLPFSSELDILHRLLYPGIAVVMLYVAFALKRNREVTPRQIMAIAVVYALLFAYTLTGYLINIQLWIKMPIVRMLFGPLIWLVLRGWFSWLLVSGARKLAAAIKVETTAVVEPTSTES